MTHRPIIFSAPMVHALLAGAKTQTRRLLRPQPLPHRKPTQFKWVGTCRKTDRRCWEAHDQKGPMSGVFPGPPGCVETQALTLAVGNRLWVREAWRPSYAVEGYREDLGRVARPSDFDPTTTAIEYLADGTRELGGKDRPSIHMPRWASRLTLLVTDVRIQRLHEISEAEAIAEGAHLVDFEAHGPSSERGKPPLGPSPRARFEALWGRLHGPDAWNANPWVVATSFTVQRGNIDALPSAVPEREAAFA